MGPDPGKVAVAVVVVEVEVVVVEAEVRTGPTCRPLHMGRRRC